MAFYYVVLLIVAIVALSTGSKAESTAIGAKTTTTDFPTRSLAEIPDDVPTTRMLRTFRAQDEEERVVNVPTTAKLVNWLVTPKSAEVKLTLAEKLRIGKWVLKNKNSEYVFKRLNLDKGLDEVLTNSKLHIYSAYIDRFNKKNTKNPMTMLDMFTNTYSDDAVAKMIEVAMTAPSTKKIASRMRNELLSGWESKGKTADDIFTLLKLDTAGITLFKSPQMTKDSNPTLNLYAAFVDRYNKQKPTEKVTMVDLFTKRYGDEAVAKMVEMGMNVPSTKIVASRLRDELMSSWEDKVESSTAIFSLLKLDEAGGDLFVTPQLNTWYAYTKMTYTQPPEEIMVPILTAHYGYDGLSKIFINAQLKVRSMRFLALKLETTMAKMRLKEKLSST